MAEGSCLCGRIRYRIDGPFSMMMHCHCSMCRKQHGSNFATFVAAPLAGFSWLSGAETVRSYQSSERGERSFCGSCGSVTPMLMTEMQIVICPAGNLDGELGIKPQAHMFVGSKAPGYRISDGLPQHEEYPPGFGAQGQPRPAVAPKPGVVQGSCLCGDVAFELEGAPLRFMNCHCSRCRKSRGAAHASNMFYRPEQFRFTRGAGKVVDYAHSGAQYFGSAFCQRCGSIVPRVSRERGIVLVPAGPLDEDPGAQPLGHIYVDSKASWFDISDHLPQFAEMPPRT